MAPSNQIQHWLTIKLGRRKLTLIAAVAFLNVIFDVVIGHIDSLVELERLVQTEDLVASRNERLFLRYRSFLFCFSFST